MKTRTEKVQRLRNYLGNPPCSNVEEPGDFLEEVVVMGDLSNEQNFSRQRTARVKV